MYCYECEEDVTVEQVRKATAKRIKKEIPAGTPYLDDPHEMTCPKNDAHYGGAIDWTSKEEVET